MIYVMLYGRLGNNLFQIATAASMAKRSGQDFSAFLQKSYYCTEPDNCYLPEYIEPFRSTILRKVKFVEETPQGLRIIYIDPNMELLTIPPEESVVVVVVDNFNTKWLDSDVVKELFEIDDKSLIHIKTHYAFLLDDDKNFCSVVVRRGDYMSLLNDYAICSVNYYKKAMKTINKRCGIQKFLIISDDIDWCKRNLAGNNVYFIDDEPPLIDLYLSALCKNHIISNSTFAFWGCLLTKQEGITCCPSPWFGISQRKLESGQQKFLPIEWVRIDNYSIYYLVGILIYLKKVVQKYSFKFFSLIFRK